MIAPASDAAIKSPTATGKSENAAAARPESTSRSSSSVPRPPPTNSTRASVRTSVIFKAGARLPLGARPRGTGRAMVAVGDVQGGNPARRLHQPVAITAVEAPDCVTHAVNRVEIDERVCPGSFSHDLIDICAGTIDQKHRP